MSDKITPEKAAFIEGKTKEMFDYTLDCLGRARTDGNTVLQWLFGVVVGALGFVGSLLPTKYWPIGVGMLAASAWAAWAAVLLINALKSQVTMPPGNLAESLNAMLNEPEERMRWREARGMDERIRVNLRCVEQLATSVDAARTRFARLPLWFIGGSLLGSLAWLLWNVMLSPIC